MAETRIADLITPDAWNTYGVQRSSALSALWQAGIVASVPGLLLPQGGATINMPYFNDLTGDSEILSETTPLAMNNITSGKDVAVLHLRGKMWGASDLSAVISGADPVRAIMDMLAGWWARDMQTTLIKTLTGAFAAASMSGNVSDISGGVGAAAVIDAGKTIDAAYLLGDSANNLIAIAMHSATMAKLAKDQLITYETTADKTMTFPLYLGKRVVVDDGLPVATGVYTTYLFGAGAVGFVNGIVGPKELEVDRDIAGGIDALAMRRRFLMHPRGIKWIGTPAGEAPTNTELATGTNWTRVYDNKQIRIVQFKHKIA